MANSCKYYTEKTLAWMLNNKLIVFLSLLTFSLFVSTWALAAQKNRALSRIDDLNAELAAATTLAPVTNPEEPGTGGETEGNGDTGGNGGTGDGGTGDGGTGDGATGDGGTGDGGTGDGGTGDGGTGDGGTVDGGTGDGGTSDRGTGDGVVPKSRKSIAMIDESEVADQEETDDTSETDVVNSNDRFNSIEDESDLQSLVQNSKLLAALNA